jgi:hypothetical protein
MGECTLRWLTFCPFLDFIHNVFYSNATKTLSNNQFDKNIYEFRLPT